MKRLFSQKGFTVIELLVVLGIIVLISATILANYRGQQRESALVRSAQKLALDLRRAQTLAVSSILHHSEIPYGYGVRFEWTGGGDNDSYFIFAKCDGTNLYYNSGVVCFSPPPPPSWEEKVETFKFETGVKIANLKGEGGSNCTGGGPTNSLDIVFKPPEPTTTVVRNSDNTRSCNTGTITLTLTEDPSKTKIVEVNSTTGEIKIR